MKRPRISIRPRPSPIPTRTSRGIGTGLAIDAADPAKGRVASGLRHVRERRSVRAFGFSAPGAAGRTGHRPAVLSESDSAPRPVGPGRRAGRAGVDLGGRPEAWRGRGRRRGYVGPGRWAGGGETVVPFIGSLSTGAGARVAASSRNSRALGRSVPDDIPGRWRRPGCSCRRPASSSRHRVRRPRRSTPLQQESTSTTQVAAAGRLTPVAAEQAAEQAALPRGRVARAVAAVEAAPVARRVARAVARARVARRVGRPVALAHRHHRLGVDRGAGVARAVAARRVARRGVSRRARLVMAAQPAEGHQHRDRSLHVQSPKVFVQVVPDRRPALAEATPEAESADPTSRITPTLRLFATPSSHPSYADSKTRTAPTQGKMSRWRKQGESEV